MPVRAVVTFDDAGAAKRVLAYPERRWRSTPRELAPRQGDRFTPFAQVLSQPTQGGDWNVTAALSTPLTLRDRPLRAVTEPLMPGDYLAGVVVQDPDGGLAREYVPLAIR